MPQRVLQQRPKNVVEAGEESRVRRGLPGLKTTDMQRISIKKTVHRHCLCFFRDRGRGRDRDRGRGRDRGRDRGRFLRVLQTLEIIWPAAKRRPCEDRACDVGFVMLRGTRPYRAHAGGTPALPGRDRMRIVHVMGGLLGC